MRPGTARKRAEWLADGPAVPAYRSDGSLGRSPEAIPPSMDSPREILARPGRARAVLVLTGRGKAVEMAVRFRCTGANPQEAARCCCAVLCRSSFRSPSFL